MANDITPSVSEFLNAANWEYSQSGGNPADLTPFLVNGQQLSYSNSQDGIKANAWLTPGGQVIAAYQGTQFVSAANLAADPVQSFDQVIEDAGVADGQTPAGEIDAASFARQTTAAAAAQGISSSNVFLTGHSLGGIQAQYAAQQTGLGGIAFESTGIPRSSTTAGDGTNFVNVVTYGDSVGNYSSDIAAEQPFSPTFSAGGTGALPHYGYVAMVGSAADQAALATEAQPSAAGAAGVGLTAIAYGGQLAAFHLPDVQAHDLGVTLTQQPIGDQVGVRTAPVLNAADFTISQLIQATSASYSAPLAPDPAISASSGPYAGQAASTISAGESLADLSAVCFATGTRILTTDHFKESLVAVEDLRIGDLAVTNSGVARPIIWIGQRTIECSRHPRANEVMPVRIAAHAFAENSPVRQLVVSPGHSIAVDLLGEVLIPASSLINGTTIRQEEVERVTYWHVELESHDVLMAENLPTESYLAMQNRGFFSRAGQAIALHAAPDAAPASHADFCRPFHAAGSVVEFVRDRLVARALQLGWTQVENPLADLHLIVDGCRIEAEVRGLSARFLVPATAETVWLESDTVVPAMAGGGVDLRTLGVCVGKLVIDDGFGSQVVVADDPRLALGFHHVEEGPQRWTVGQARLPAALWDHCSGTFFLRVELTRPALPKWVGPSGAFCEGSISHAR